MTDPESPTGPAPSGVDPRLLEVLICPVTRHPLVYDRAAGELISKRARLAFPIRNGIPILLEGEARDLDELPDLGAVPEPPAPKGEGT